MGTCDVFQLPYDDVCDLCRRYSRGNSKTGKNSKELSSQFLKLVARTRVTVAEINSLFGIFKYDIIISLNSLLGILKDEKK